ncbi:MAG: hypothetical protein HY815_04720 [Candidatus Riflebacteria bacterium]|nr:hypothetical protein [Candidatus Riflebacteria bacterium]
MDKLRYVRRQCSLWKGKEFFQFPLNWRRVLLAYVIYQATAVVFSYLLRGADLDIFRNVVNMGIAFVPGLVLWARSGRVMPVEAAVVGTIALIVMLPVKVACPHHAWSFAGSLWRMAVACVFSSGLCGVASLTAAHFEIEETGAKTYVAGWAVATYLVYLFTFSYGLLDEETWFIEGAAYFILFCITSAGLPQGESDS